jgi:hypothetical protein
MRPGQPRWRSDRFSIRRIWRMMTEMPLAIFFFGESEFAMNE